MLKNSSIFMIVKMSTSSDQLFTLLSVSVNTNESSEVTILNLNLQSCVYFE